jgi:hypothetical protein
MYVGKLLHVYRRTSTHLVLKKVDRHFNNPTGALQTAVTKSCDHTVGCVCVICEIATLPEEETNDGSKHVGV